MSHTRRASGPPRTRAVTLQDVAAEAGVAVSTASRALTNPARVSERTREHVHAVAQRLRYRPNLIARALPSGRTGMIGLLLPDITNPHNFGLVRGAEEQARAAGYTLVIADSQDRAELESDHLHRLDSAVDGFVLAPSRLSDDDLQRVGGRRPVVLFNRRAEGFPSVLTDPEGGSRQVVAHLAALGHRRICYLAGPAAAWMDGQRRRALAEHAAAAGIRFHAVGPFPPTLAGGADAAEAGLGSGASALVAFNDLLAIGVLRQLERRGVAVPAAVSVVGFDDIFGADFCHPPLTTVAAPAEVGGRAVIDLLLGPVADDVLLPTLLVVRDSTGPPA